MGSAGRDICRRNPFAMCELLGLSAREKLTANKILRIFYSHGEEHPHGWGLALFRSDGSPVVEKEPIKSTASHYLKARLDANIQADNLIGHIRLATMGMLDYENCHPFAFKDIRGRNWTIAHNGTIFDCPSLNRYVKVQNGATDSERVALYLVDEINRETTRLGHDLGFEERFAVLERVVCDLTRQNNKVNLLVYDGAFLFVHTNYKNSLHVLRDEGVAWISTHPLTDESWEEVPFCRLCAFHDGELVKTGVDHGGEYVVRQQDLDQILMTYSHL